MVLFDGEKLIVQINRSNYKHILSLAKRTEDNEYLSAAGLWVFPATRRIARILHDMGNSFDPSAAHFISQGQSKDDYIDKLGLYDFQKEGVHWLLRDHRHKLIGDEMGLGKSVQASTYLKLDKDSLPAVIVCPASVKLDWERKIETWTGVRSTVLYGMKSFPMSIDYLQKFQVVIINYDILGEEDSALREKENERIQQAKARGQKFRRANIPLHGWIKILIALPFKTIICDEVQYISGDGTIRTRAVQQLCRSVKARRIFLSGTPYESHTKQFFTCLNLIDNNNFPNRWAFQMRYCDPDKGHFGWRFDGLSNGEELHNKLKPIMLRRLKKDVLTQLPPKQKSIIPLEVSKTDFAKYLEIDNMFLDSISKDDLKGLGLNEHISKLKRAAYEAKKKSAIKWIKEYLAVENKLVVFVYHRDSFKEICKEFGKECVGLNGETPTAERQKAIDKFMRNDKVHLFVGQIRAAGVGITLTAAKAVAFLEFGNTIAQHSQAEDRVHRIGQESDSIMAYYLIAKDSVDEDIMALLNDRNKEIVQVMDGQDAEYFFGEMKEDFNAGILQQYKKRKGLK